jgi:pyruvate/2-oxoglutarate dehydrogenase complex dihydrolipoamide acyltransferase (E2) component
VVTGIAALLFGASASFGAGTAIAAPLIGTCGGEVEGEPGTPVAVRLAGSELVTVGEVPASGSAKLSASKLPLLGGKVCSVTATAVETAAPVTAPVQETLEPVGETVGIAPAPAPAQSAPAQPAPEQPAPEQSAPVQQPDAASDPLAAAPAPAAMPFGPFLAADFTPQLGSDFGQITFYDYSRLFTAGPSAFGSVSSPDLFGSSPTFGILGAEDAAGAAQDVAAAGRALTLPTQGADRVALPVLAAVLMLSAVTAALVRSWVHGAPRA